MWSHRLSKCSWNYKWVPFVWENWEMEVGCRKWRTDSAGLIGVNLSPLSIVGNRKSPHEKEGSASASSLQLPLSVWDVTVNPRPHKCHQAPSAAFYNTLLYINAPSTLFAILLYTPIHSLNPPLFVAVICLSSSVNLAVKGTQHKTDSMCQTERCGNAPRLVLCHALDKHIQNSTSFSPKKVWRKHLLNGSSANEALPVKWRIE